MLCFLSPFVGANDKVIFECVLKAHNEKITLTRNDQVIYVSYSTPEEAKMEEGGRYISLVLGSDLIQQAILGNTSQGFSMYTLKFQSDEMATPHYIDYEWNEGKYSASYYAMNEKADRVNSSDCLPQTIKADGILLSSGIDGVPEMQ
ncbi:Uncharacterised protein [Budvicia aquatica]|nr:Uncharacterised protein [Budvicia aquatica]